MLCNLVRIEKILERYVEFLQGESEIEDLLENFGITGSEEILEVAGEIALVRKDIQQGNGG